MKLRHLRSLFALLAVLGTPTAMAASVTIVASNPAPTVGDTFTLTVTGDVGNTFAATMGLAFDTAKVAYVSGTATGAWNVFVKNSPASATPTVFDIETPTATAASPGIYSSAILTFQALAAGDAGIVINDDGGNNSGWFDAITADYIPVTYTQATVSITANGPVATVTDSVAPAGDLTVPFGQVTEGTISTAQTVTVTNDGNQDLTLGAVALANALDLPFGLVSDTCTNQTLTPTSSCNVTVDFAPASTGPFSDSFDIPTNDPARTTVTVAVNGTGTAAPVGNIVVTDSIAPLDDLQLAFGNVTASQTATGTVTIANDGTANLTVGQVAVANAVAPPFGIANDNCSSQVLAPAGSCTFQVQFQPTLTGAFSDTFDIPSDDPDAPTVAFSATGTGTPIPVPDIAVTDAIAPADDLALPYGDVDVGTSVTRIVTVSNSGTVDLVLGTVATANPLPAPFSVATDTCSGQALAPAATCTIGVTFSPTAAQIYNESFDIPSNDPDEAAVTITVGGTGIAMPDIAVTDDIAPAGDLSLTYGAVDVGTSVTRTVTVTNTGTANLVLGTVAASNPLPAPFSIATDTCSGQTVAPAATCTIGVAFAPTAAQVYNDSFNIPSDDPDEGTVTISVGGTGMAVASGGGGGSAVDGTTLALLAGVGLAGLRRKRAAGH